MPIIDAENILGYAKAVKTDGASTDAATIDIPVRGSGYVVTKATVYNTQGGSSALATLSVRGGAGGTGTSIVADAALTGVTGSTVVSERTVAATALTPAVTDDKLYVRVGTASGVAGTTLDIVLHGYSLP